MNRMISRTIAATAMTLFAMAAVRASTHDNAPDTQVIAAEVSGDDTLEARKDGRRSRHTEGRHSERRGEGRSHRERHGNRRGERHDEGHHGRN